MIRISPNRLVAFTALLICVSAAVSPAAEGTLRAGAARVDITPAGDAALPMGGYAGRTEGFKGIHDNIFVRAIVVDDGSTQAAVVGIELVGVTNSVLEKIDKRVEKETGIPRDNIMLASVHTHAAPLTGPRTGEPEGKQAAYAAKVEEGVISSIRQAKANLQPARVGFGSGKAYVNINRRDYFPDNGWYWLGYNPDQVSDKTLAVLKFESLSGKPIALFINYPVHAVVMGPRNYQVSGDLAGATSRFVERYYKGRPEDRPRGDAGYAIRLKPQEVSDDVVAVWTSGTAGDQNPISMSNTEDFTLVEAFGKMLGEESVRIANGITTSQQARIRAARRTVTCPGRTLEPGQSPRKEYKFQDTPNPVSFQLSSLIIGDTALAGISGEVLTNIGLHLKRDSPLNHTVVVTHANGTIGYIPSDSLFDQLISYENTASRLKPGCAENTIVNTLLEMIGQP